MKKNIIAAVVVLVVVIIIANQKKTPKITTYQDVASISQNVISSEDKQIVEITAKGGYSPSVTTAKANMPTIIRVLTKATFDCSSSLRIPSISYSNNLPTTGTTDIEIPPQAIGTTLQGVCSMGMYHFSINFIS